MALRLVLMGTGEFAVPPFRAILESPHTTVAVVTQPEREGAGHHRHRNPIRELALAAGIPVHQPQRINRPEVLDVLRQCMADVFVVAAYGQILKPELLSIPRLGAFNLHGSILPRHRGAAPVQYSIWTGDQTAGVTVFQIEPALDSGPVVGTVETPIRPEETSGDLMARLAELSAPLILKVLDQLEHGTAEFQIQDPSLVTLAPRISREAGVINWQATPRQIECQVRAMQPWPKPSSVLIREGFPPLRCLILKVALPDSGTPAPTAIPCGSIDTGHGKLQVKTSDGWVEICTIQPEGRKAVDGAAFLRGYPLKPGDHFQASP